MDVVLSNPVHTVCKGESQLLPDLEQPGGTALSDSAPEEGLQLPSLLLQVSSSFAVSSSCAEPCSGSELLSMGSGFLSLLPSGPCLHFVL